MKQETKIVCDKKWASMNKGNTSCGAIYAMGFIGATVYYIQHANTFLMGVLGFLKALVWPTFLVYNAIKFLGF